MIDSCRLCKDHVILIGGVCRIEWYHITKVTVVLPACGICPKHMNQLSLIIHVKIIEKYWIDFLLSRKLVTNIWAYVFLIFHLWSTSILSCSQHSKSHPHWPGGVYMPGKCQCLPCGMCTKYLFFALSLTLRFDLIKWRLWGDTRPQMWCSTHESSLQVFSPHSLIKKYVHPNHILCLFSYAFSERVH
jgi:hypothetical protein